MHKTLHTYWSGFDILEGLCFWWLDNANNDSEETKSTTKDLNDKDLDECGWGLCISKGTTCTYHTNTNTAEEIGETHWQTWSKHCKSSGESLNNNIINEWISEW